MLCALENRNKANTKHSITCGLFGVTDYFCLALAVAIKFCYDSIYSYKLLSGESRAARLCVCATNCVCPCTPFVYRDCNWSVRNGTLTTADEDHVQMEYSKTAQFCGLFLLFH